MTAPLFLVSPGSLAGLQPGSEVTVQGAEAHHAVAVMRVRIGEQVFVCDGAGTRALADVTGVDRHTVHALCRVVETQPPPDPRVVLLQALAKGDRDEQAIEAATELGVDVVVPWQAERSVVQWRDERAERGRRKWESIVLAASKQARRFRVPEVRPLARRQDVAELLAGARLAIELHENAGMPLGGLALPQTGDVVVVVGPEGGISPEELTAFDAAGGRQVRLGREVLRASSAGPAGLAVLNAAGRWR